MINIKAKTVRVGSRAILLRDWSGLKKNDACVVKSICCGECSHRQGSGLFVFVERHDGVIGSHLQVDVDIRIED